MTRACCPSCRLRFTRAATAHLTTCPECGAPLPVGIAARDAVGYKLYDIRDSAGEFPVAQAVALPEPHLPELG
jgi:hypothetical protein